MVGKNSCIASPKRTPIKEKSDISVILLTSPNHKTKNYGPKSLLRLTAGHTILEHQVSTIRTILPESDILLCVGDDSDKIIKERSSSKVRIIENQCFADTGEAEYLRLAMNASLTNKVLIINSDLYFDAEAVKSLCDSKESILLYDSLNKMKSGEIGVGVTDGLATVFSFKVPTKWANMVMLVGNDIQVIKQIISDKTKKKLYLFEVLNSFVDRFPIKAVESRPAKLSRIDSPKDVEKLND